MTDLSCTGAIFTEGFTQAADGKPVSDVYEIDFDLQWKVRKGALNGFWPRIRYAIANEDRSIHEIRVVMNYDVSIL